MLISCTSC